MLYTRGVGRYHNTGNIVLFLFSGISYCIFHIFYRSVLTASPPPLIELPRGCGKEQFFLSWGQNTQRGVLEGPWCKEKSDRVKIISPKMEKITIEEPKKAHIAIFHKASRKKTNYPFGDLPQDFCHLKKPKFFSHFCGGGWPVSHFEEKIRSLTPRG
jgi:hypothetical protein